MLFSFSSSSFHSSFPPPAPDSLLTTCETYAVWLTLQICCIHYLVIVHICFCHSLSLYIPSLCLMSLMMINLIFSVFAQFVLATSFFFFSSPLCALPMFRSLSFYLCLISFLHHHHHHSLHRPPPLTRLNSSSLLPFRLFCRAPVTPSGVTRTVSDSRRTCYLVTRL